MWEIAAPFAMYEVSDSGEVRNIITKRLLSQQVNNRGYKKVFLSDNGKQLGAKVVGE